ncbi:putative alpha-helical pore forming toxin [Encephalitozoon hellem]|uniref:Alpha-helical pore forming toxin n=1 Tax=Encephalitozoon hellem TaxID=27973 RepID=A0A9Q9F8Y5_ENCHE|nr:tyrosine-protein phosphatase non-receptor type 23 [Encephalitozoon hellem]WEL38002.1 putative alpha-helical pore forming toxin [Encephalitozoon hellem]
MGNEKNKEMIRCELESYVAEEMKSVSPSTRQMDAIEKMASLPEKNFEDLVSDIVNEMRRRSNVPSISPETPMQWKLSRIHEDGFKSLVLDLLLVMNQRSPEDKRSSENVHGLINNLDKLISSLKEDMMNEEKMAEDICSSRDISDKFMMFIEYSRNVFDRNGEDIKVHEHMMKEVKEYFEAQTIDGPDLTINVDVLLKKCDRLKHSNLPEYKYHRNNIQRLKAMDLGIEVKKRLIRDEVLQIYSIFVTESTNLKGAREKQLECKVNSLVDVLCKIKSDAEEGKEIDAYEYLEDVASSSGDILELVENMELESKAYLDQLKTKIAALEQIHNRSSGEEPLPAMFSTIEAVKRVLTDVPRSQGSS